MTALRFCERCQKMVPGRDQHFCVKMTVAPLPAQAPAFDDPTHGNTHNPTHAKPKKGKLCEAQTYRWRERYPDRWRAYHAEYMRKWRLEKALNIVAEHKKAAHRGGAA
jgi:hypothetical protein